MRRLIAFALILVVTPLAGCLKAKDHVTLNKDGSGTIVSSYEVDLTKARALLTTVAMLMGQGDPEQIAKMKDEHLMNFEHPNWFRQKAGEVEGYDVQSATQQIVPVKDDDKDGPKKRVSGVEASFTSLAAAAQAQAFPIMSVSLSRVEKSEKLPKGAWKLVVKDMVSSIDPAQTQGMDPAQMLPMFEEQLKTLNSTFTFTIPGKIIETNGKQAEDGCTASLKVDYDTMLSGKSVGLTIVFSAAEGAKLTPFTHSPDLMALMPRLQQKPPVLAKEKPTTGGAAEAGKGPAVKEGEKPAEGEAKPDEPKKDAPAKDAPAKDEPAPKKDG